MMKLKELRELERHIKVIEAAVRLEREDIKGLSVQVVFDSPARPGGQDIPVQFFIPADSGEYQTIFPVLEAKVSESKVEAEGKLETFKTKFAK